MRGGRHVVVEAESGGREQGLVLAVCYVPLKSSSCGRSSEGYFQLLTEHVTLVMCGNFNSRCRELMEDPEALPRCQVLDMVKNRQSEDLIDLLKIQV